MQAELPPRVTQQCAKKRWRISRQGSPVLAQILLVNISEEESKDRLWRRELNRVGQSGHYVQHENPGPNTLVIDHYESFEGVGIVIAARFAVTISPLTAVHLAELAIKSARLERTGRDGITYLIDAKRNGVTTPLSVDYEQEIVRQTQTSNLHEALRKIQTNA
jgi:hypothetical protein